MEKSKLIDDIIKSTASLNPRKPNERETNIEKTKEFNLYLSFGVTLFLAFLFDILVISLAGGISELYPAGKAFLVILFIPSILILIAIIRLGKKPYKSVGKENEARKAASDTMRRALEEEKVETLDTILNILKRGTVNNLNGEELFSNSAIKWILSAKGCFGGSCTAVSSNSHEYYIYNTGGSDYSGISLDKIPVLLEGVDGHFYEYTPSKIYVGGAAVGGVITGGAFDAGNFMTSSKYSTDKVKLKIEVNGKTDELKLLQARKEVIKKYDFFNSFQFDSSSTVILEHYSSSLSSNFRPLIQADPGLGYSALNRAVNETYMTNAEAQTLLSILTSIARGSLRDLE